MIKELKESLYIPICGISFLCGLILLYYFRGEEPKNWDAIFGISLVDIGVLFLIMFIQATFNHFENKTNSVGGKK